jgi:hypothetical protein
MMPSTRHRIERLEQHCRELSNRCYELEWAHQRLLDYLALDDVKTPASRKVLEKSRAEEQKS